MLNLADVFISFCQQFIKDIGAILEIKYKDCGETPAKTEDVREHSSGRWLNFDWLMGAFTKAPYIWLNHQNALKIKYNLVSYCTYTLLCPEVTLSFPVWIICYSKYPTDFDTC